MPGRAGLTLDALFVAEHVLGGPLAGRLWGGCRERARRRVVEALRASGPGRTVPVQQVADLSPEAFAECHLRPGVPVVFRGRAAAWPALARWSRAFFQREYGSDPAVIFDPSQAGSPGCGLSTTTLGDVLARIDDPDPPYARFHPLLDRHPELLHDLDRAWLDSMRVRASFGGFPFHTLFLGPKGSSTPIHCAGNENLFVQVQGRKRWRFWRPDARFVLDPRANRAPAKACPVDPDAPDEAVWPGFEELDHWQVVLEPGDVLYVPAYAWHHVVNLDQTLGAATRWTSVPNSVRQAPLYFALEFLNTRPTLFRTMFPKGELDVTTLLAEAHGDGAGGRRPTPSTRTSG